MKENQDTHAAPRLDVAKPDTTPNLRRYQIWYQDVCNPNLWRSRTGGLLDTSVQGGDFYLDTLQVFQVIVPLDVRGFYRQR